MSPHPDLDRIFKAYDVRGVVPDDLNEDVAGARAPTVSTGPRRSSRISTSSIAAKRNQDLHLGQALTPQKREG